MTQVQNTDKCDLVLVAGGKGSRFESQVPKQFEPLNGRPLYLWSLDIFLSWAPLGNVALVVPSDWVAPVKESLKILDIATTIQVVAGGASRQFSASHGLASLENISKNSWVMIHDAARPAITPELLDRLWNARKLDSLTDELGGIVPGVSVAETIKVVEKHVHGSKVLETLNRENLKTIQTPQLLKRELLLEAYGKFKGEGSAPDDASLIEKLGFKIIVVDGDYDNVKITFLEDRNRVSNWFRERRPQI